MSVETAIKQGSIILDLDIAPHTGSIFWGGWKGDKATWSRTSYAGGNGDMPRNEVLFGKPSPYKVSLVNGYIFN